MRFWNKIKSFPYPFTSLVVTSPLKHTHTLPLKMSLVWNYMFVCRRCDNLGCKRGDGKAKPRKIPLMVLNVAIIVVLHYLKPLSLCKCITSKK